MKNNFDYWDYLPGVDAYIDGGNTTKVYRDISSILKDNSNRRIDKAGVLSILMKNYCLNNRTLISDVEKIPWMSKVENDKFIYSELPLHNNISLSSMDVANNLISLMRLEALSFLEGKDTVGILLSGGMDSRIVAGILRKLQNERNFLGKVVAISWGDSLSRDVIYSKRIAEKFSWDYIHIPIDAETLYENIKIAGLRGAEFSPVHLHAMNDVSKLSFLDGIFAGSYGDSIGRGEYSGLKVNQLRSLLNKHLNHFSFMRKDAQQEAIELLKKDISSLRNIFPGRDETSYREIEMQAHYMRRQLSPCMKIIGEKIPLYQMFTSPKVFGFMWGLDFKCRNDDVYEKMLSILPGELLTIPWSRDGRRYNDPKAPSEDSYPKLYHRYGDWLRNDNRKFVVDLINRGTLQDLGIFNNKALDFWVNNWRNDNRAKCDRLDEKMAWLASLSVFVEAYDIIGEPKNNKSTVIDEISIYTSALYEKAYFITNKLLNRYK